MKVLVVGMGASAYGLERRAVQSLANMPEVSPYFLISKWEDGSVSRLLGEYGFEYGYAPWGYLGRAKPQWTLVTLLHTPSLWARVISCSRRQDCQAIMFLSVSPFINALPAMLYLRLAQGLPLVYYFGDVPPQGPAYRLAARLMRACSRSFVVNSEAVRAGLLALGVPEASIRTVYNGVDLKRFLNAVRRDFRSEFGWPSEAVIVAFAGQLNPRKGVEDFLEAASLAQAAQPELRFLVMGRLDPGDPFHRKLTSMAASRSLEGNLKFIGWAEPMEEALAGIDVLATPSRHEDAAPNVILEAMASGKPVIGTRTGGVPELISDRITGILVDKQSPRQLAAGMIELSRDPALRNRLGSAGRRACRERFDLVSNATAVREVLANA